MNHEEKLDLVLRKLVNLESVLLKESVATVDEITDKYGDPKINFDPRKWAGQSYRGTVASACPPDFLDVYAGALEYMAANPKEGQDPKYTGYNRKDARLLRRWAIEKREGRVVTPVQAFVKDELPEW